MVSVIYRKDVMNAAQKALAQYQSDPRNAQAIAANLRVLAKLEAVNAAGRNRGTVDYSADLANFRNA